MKNLTIFKLALFLLLTSCQLPSRNLEVPRKNLNLELVPVDSNQISFVAIGDTGTGTKNQYKVAGAVNQWCQIEKNDCQFVLLLGDNFYDSGASTKLDKGDVAWQEKILTPYANLPAQFYPVMGNHDYSFHGRFLSNWNWGRIENQVMSYEELGTFKLQSKGSDKNYPKWYFPHQYYTINRGPAIFLALDTPRIIFDKEISLQHKLSETILGSNIWRIGFGHHPLYSNGFHGNAGQYAKYGNWREKFFGEQTSGTLLKEFFNHKNSNGKSLCQNLDFYFSGHDHNRQVIPPNSDCTMYSIVSGAGAKVKKFYPDENGKFENKFLWQNDTKRGFTYVKINGARLSLQMINDDGEVEYNMSCGKNPHEQKALCIETN